MEEIQQQKIGENAPYFTISELSKAIKRARFLALMPYVSL